jgi:DNA ligase (NAD+)
MELPKGISDVSGFTSAFAQRYDEQRLTEEDLDQAFALLEYASSEYYGITGTKVMSDEEYDWMKDVVEYFRGTLKYGAAPVGLKGTVSIPHEYDYLLGTLSKGKSVIDLMEWLRDKFAKLGKSTARIGTSLKFDGNSFYADFEAFDAEAELLTAVTRGRDGVGMDLTHAFKGRLRAPEDPDLGIVGRFAIKYEAMTTHSRLDEMEEKLQLYYANPRAAVAGILGKDEGEESRQRLPYIVPVPLGVQVFGKSISRQTELDYIGRHFMPVDSEDTRDPWFMWWEFDGTPEEIAQQIGDQLYDPFAQSRREMDYLIDGLVVEFLDDLDRGRLGWTNVNDIPDHPNYALAVKLPYMEKESVVEDVFLSYKGKRLTPMAKYAPVEFNGAIQTKTSLANWLRYDQMKLGIGTRVLIEYRNDVLSYLQRIASPENDIITPKRIKEECPSCKSGLRFTRNKDGERVFAYCSNTQCPGLLEARIVNWLKKNDVKGVKESTVAKLIEGDLVKSLTDIYSVQLLDAAQLPGMGKKSADLLVNAFNQTKQPWDYVILGAVGIEGVGRTIAKRIMRHISLIELLVAVSEIDNEEDETEKTTKRMRMITSLKKLPDFDTTRAMQVIEGVSLYYDDLAWFYTHLDFRSFKEALEQRKASKASAPSYRVVVTGKLHKWATRDAFVSEVELLGHRVTESISSDVDYLVTNDASSGSSKLQKAAKLKVKVVSEDEFRTLIGLGG